MNANESWMHRLVRWSAMLATVGGVTLLSRAASANEITAGLLLLVAVLGSATWGGWAVGAVASVAATLCLNFFFLPPTGTFAIEAPSNWVALGCFLAASTLVSRLVTLARQEAEEARERQRELEALYELSLALFRQQPGNLDDAAARTLRAIGAEAGALALAGSEPVVVGGPVEIDCTLVEAVSRHSGVVEDAGTSYIPLQIGGGIGQTSGVLLAVEPAAPPTVLRQAVRLLALAIERRRLLQEAA